MNDNELISILKDIRADIKGLKADIKGLKDDTQELKTDTQGLKVDTQGLKANTQELKANIQELKAGQDKHSLLLEELKSNMSTVIEGQQAQSEQIDRQFILLNKDMKEDSTLIKSALKSVSSDVKNIKQKLIH